MKWNTVFCIRKKTKNGGLLTLRFVGRTGLEPVTNNKQNRF